MEQFSFIINESAAKAIAKVLEEKVKVEKYEDNYVRVTFLNTTSMSLLSLFHAGQDYGWEMCKSVIEIKS